MKWRKDDADRWSIYDDHWQLLWDCSATECELIDEIERLRNALRLTLRAVELAGWEGDYAAVEARAALGEGHAHSEG